MHFEVLVEDQSGEKLLEILLPRIVGSSHTYRIKSYKGIGRIPKGFTSGTDARKRILLDQLPKLLKGYGKTFSGSGDSTQFAVIVVCDLDDKCLSKFRGELLEILHGCDPRPETRFCIAVEEGEAWLLGDMVAIRTAYPKVKETILASYTNDSICGTWELLANALYKGGSAALRDQGWPAVGAAKSDWALHIGKYMNVDTNLSPSFVYFRNKLRDLCASG